MSRERKKKKWIPVTPEIVQELRAKLGSPEDRFADDLRLRLQSAKAVATCERAGDSIKAMTPVEFEEYQQTIYGDGKGITQ